MEALLKEQVAAQRVKRRLTERARATSSGRAPLRIEFQLDPATWQDDLRNILVAVSDALDGKLPSPTLLSERADRYVAAISEHIISVTHEPKGGYHPRRAIYRIAVKGSRLDGVWSYSPGQLQAALEAAASTKIVQKS